MTIEELFNDYLDCQAKSIEKYLNLLDMEYADWIAERNRFAVHIESQRRYDDDIESLFAIIEGKEIYHLVVENCEYEERANFRIDNKFAEFSYKDDLLYPLKFVLYRINCKKNHLNEEENEI